MSFHFISYLHVLIVQDPWTSTFHDLIWFLRLIVTMNEYYSISKNYSFFSDLQLIWRYAIWKSSSSHLGARPALGVLICTLRFPASSWDPRCLSGLMPWKILQRWTGWWLTYPSEKYEFVSWGSYFQYMEKSSSHVPNHQPVEVFIGKILRNFQGRFPSQEIARFFCLLWPSKLQAMRLPTPGSTAIWHHGSAERYDRINS